MAVHYFGFGSLVSQESIAVPVVALERARIFGYRRVWCQPFSVAGTTFASLGLEPGVATDYVDGVRLEVADSDAAYFDEREAGYRQIEVEAMHSDGRTCLTTSFEARVHATSEALIPLSYVATVAVGFWNMYGKETGLQMFLDNTYGWEKSIAYDVAEPIYPRRPEGLTAIADDIRGALEGLTSIVEV